MCYCTLQKVVESKKSLEGEGFRRKREDSQFGTFLVQIAIMLKLEDIKSSSHVMSMKAHPKLFSIRSNNFYESKDNFRSYPKYSLCVYLETWRIRTTLIKNKTAAVKAEKTH